VLIKELSEKVTGSNPVLTTTKNKFGYMDFISYISVLKGD
jgi:hypothetical protein